MLKASKCMKGMEVLEPQVHVTSAVDEGALEQIDALAKAIVAKLGE